MARLTLLWTVVMVGMLGSCWGSSIPRVSFPLGSPGRSLGYFTGSETANTTTLLLSNDGKTLYVGSRNSILSLDVSEPRTMELRNKLDWSPSEKDLKDCAMKGKKTTDCPNFVRVLQVLNSTHMYACGTFAFSPRCTYIDSDAFTLVQGPSGKPEEGRGRCPYDPYQRNTAITVDGELYTGTVADYRGNRPVISRHLSEGSHVDLKLDDTLGWLEDPTFVSSSYIPVEEKVFFFFSEVGREYDFIDKFTVSRVAQVCTSDVGGQRTLQRRWTTFAKAQLLCKSHGELPYNVLEDMFTLKPTEGTPETDTLFYGIFSSQWSVNSGRSAVCVFSLNDIRAVFAGNYKVLNRDTLKWSTRVQEKVANPGSCGLHNASDNTLRFVKENFLADESVQPSSLSLSMVSPDYRYSNIAVQRVRAAKGRNFTVLYLLTDSGYLHKTVLLEKGPHIVEEVQVFRQPQLVKNLLLSVSKGAVFVGSSEGVVEVPVANCSFYWSCAECVLARDPFCAWDPARRACVDVTTIQSNAAQDVERGNVLMECKPLSFSPRSMPLRPSTGELVSVSLNEVVRLQCPEASRLAQRHWERPNSRLSPDLYLQKEDGSLSFLATPITLGHYMCVAVECGFQQVLAVYHVKQKSSSSAATTSQPISSNPARSSPGRQPISKAAPLPTTAWGWPRKTEARGRGHEAAPTLSPQETAGVTPHRGSRNYTLWVNPVLQGEMGTSGVEGHGGPGEQQQQSNTPCYLQELVVVSVVLVLSISVLLTVALYGMRQRCRSRTVPQVCGRRGDPERGGAGNGSAGVASTPQEREVLRASPRETKKNGQAPQNGQIPNGGKTMCNGVTNTSNGHLPNTPI